jgi:hypothetical protein
MAKIHRLSLDETGSSFADSIGSLVGTRGSVTTVPGLFGNAQRATASSHYISFGDTVSDIRFTTGAFSFRTIFKAPASTSGRWLLGRWAWTTNKRAYGLYIASSSDGSYPNSIVFYTSDNGTAYVAHGTRFAITDSLWHDCVVTRNGTSFKIYVDGVLIHSTNSFYASLYDDPGNIGFDICNIVTHDVGAVDVDHGPIAVADGVFPPRDNLRIRPGQREHQLLQGLCYIEL